MKYTAPSRCPVCSSPMSVTRLNCETCATELTGAFVPCKFCALEEKHLQFIETFLRCRGNIKEVEKALNVSYPTVRNMMDLALRALGYQEDENQPSRNEQREQVLARLEKNEIGVDEALTLLEKINS